MKNPDADDLSRFVSAQENVFEHALAELRAGQKRTHWMWFIFPQLRGLGRSETAHRFGIASLEEARAYLAHPVLGPRLLAVAEALRALENKTARQIFGDIDAMKLHSSLTLFAVASASGLLGGSDMSDPAETLDTILKRVEHHSQCPVFAELLVKYFDGQADVGTRRILGI